MFDIVIDLFEDFLPLINVFIPVILVFNLIYYLIFNER